MAARPALAALGCSSCRHALLRAVVSSSSPKPWPTRFPTMIGRSSAGSRPVRHFSSCRLLLSASGQDGGQPSRSEANGEPSKTEEEPETPWYLEEALAQHPTTQHQVTLPEPPPDAPAILQPMIQYIFEDMGLDEISLLDLRDLEHHAALGSNLIMLFGTARSERHLHVASGRFVRWLRRNKTENPRADGLIGPGELKTKLRRLRKKAKLMGTNAAIVPHGDHGISTGWVCVHFTTTNGVSDESIVHDEGGRLSGFGTAQNATTVVVQCMTEARRSELDLESLWKGILKRSLAEGERIKGQASPDANALEEMVASKLHISTNPSEAQWQAMKRASQQHRYFSTSARKSVDSRFSAILNSSQRESQAAIDDSVPQPRKSRQQRRLKAQHDEPQEAIESKSHIQLTIERAWFAANPGPRKLAPDEDDDEDPDWDWGGAPYISQKSSAFAENLRKLPLAEEIAVGESLQRPRYQQPAVVENSGVPQNNGDHIKNAAPRELVSDHGSSTPSEEIQLNTLREEFERIQLSGVPVEEDLLFRLIDWVWKAEPAASNTIKDRITLVDEMLQAIQERGMRVWSSGRIIELIGGITSSPVYGPELEAVQRSLEYLLNHVKSPRFPEQTLQLLQIYASQQDWDRFWDAFRAPARYLVPRTAEEYQFAYDVLTATQDSKMCVDALRWVFPQMLQENPPVVPQGRLFESLKACILTADPAAESIMRDRPETENLIAARQLEAREFVRVLEKAYELRDLAAGDAVRQLQEDMLRV